MKNNILIFMTDQQRGDSVLSSSLAKTPNMDRFREEAATFTETHTVSPHCCPSRASFFTGQYPSQHGVWNNVNVGNTLSRGVYDDVVMWPELLEKSGYNMIFSGKWHVSDLEEPCDRGFREDQMYILRRLDKNKTKFDRPSVHEWSQYETLEASGERRDGEIQRKGFPSYTHFGYDEDPFGDKKIVDYAIDQIRGADKGNPWCTYVGTIGPHDPYYVPQRFLDMYDDVEIELPPTFYDDLEDKPRLYKRTRRMFDQLTEKEHLKAMKHYLAFCTYEDYLFGLVIDALKESGQYDSTSIIYTSDHGDYMGSHGLWCKGLPCFREAYHIPGVVRIPGLTRGESIEEFVSITDFAPTIMAMAGVEYKVGPQAKNLIPLIKGEAKEWRKYHFTQTNGNELYGIQRSVTSKDYKFVYNGFDYDELYDLKSDPNEMINQAGNPEYKGVIYEMNRAMWEFARGTEDTIVNPYIMVGLAEYGPGIVFEK